jgi:hypothetical protein
VRSKSPSTSARRNRLRIAGCSAASMSCTSRTDVARSRPTRLPLADGQVHAAADAVPSPAVPARVPFVGVDVHRTEDWFPHPPRRDSILVHSPSRCSGSSEPWQGRRTDGSGLLPPPELREIRRRSFEPASCNVTRWNSIVRHEGAREAIRSSGMTETGQLGSRSPRPTADLTRQRRSAAGRACPKASRATPRWEEPEGRRVSLTRRRVLGGRSSSSLAGRVKLRHRARPFLRTHDPNPGQPLFAGLPVPPPPGARVWSDERTGRMERSWFSEGRIIVILAE